MGHQVMRHGYYGTAVHRRWVNMKRRCYDVKNRDYYNYGGRGIKVCERWLDSFLNFLADMGEPPTEAHTLDRFPDSDGNYEPGNCRWATRAEQVDNRRVTLRLTFNGETLTAKQWALRLGVNYWTLWERIKLGQPAEIALSGPTGKYPREKWLAENWSQQ